MKFDKSKVYTALNADELEIGSKCIFADNLADLKDFVEHDYNLDVLLKVADENLNERFLGKNYSSWWYLAYLVEPTEKKKYRPFTSKKSLQAAIKKHGEWIKDITTKDYFLIDPARSFDGISTVCVLWGESAKSLFDRFIFTDDDSPCGELVEE